MSSPEIYVERVADLLFMDKQARRGNAYVKPPASEVNASAEIQSRVFRIVGQQRIISASLQRWVVRLEVVDPSLQSHRYKRILTGTKVISIAGSGIRIFVNAN